MDEEKFSEAMERLFDMVLEEMGCEHPILETIVNWFADGNAGCSYVYNEDGMFYLLRSLVNWDFFWISAEGKIDIDNANEPKIAELVSPYVSGELAMKVRKHFE